MTNIIDAARHGDTELTITLPARLGVLMNAAFPEMIASVMALTDRLLPSASEESGVERRSGWQSASLVPAAITSLTDRASAENNELPANTSRPVST
jgi:hypothetical protein